MCAAFARFAKAISDGEPHTVKLLTDWFPEPKAACQHTDYIPGIELCQWLVSHSSMEFMTINIGRALECAGIHRVATHGQYPHVDSLAGKVSSDNFTSKDVSLVIEFDSSPTDGLPWLSVTITRFDKK